MYFPNEIWKQLHHRRLYQMRGPAGPNLYCEDIQDWNFLRGPIYCYEFHKKRADPAIFIHIKTNGRNSSSIVMNDDRM